MSNKLVKNLLTWAPSYDLSLEYSKTCVKWPRKNRHNKDLYDKW